MLLSDPESDGLVVLTWRDFFAVFKLSNLPTSLKQHTLAFIARLVTTYQ